LRSKETHLHVQSWQAVVADGDAQKSICIQTPFVLVGKHKDCQIQVAPKLPKRIDLFPFAPSKVNIGGLSISTSLPTPVTGPQKLSQARRNSRPNCPATLNRWNWPCSATLKAGTKQAIILAVDWTDWACAGRFIRVCFRFISRNSWPFGTMV